MAWLDVNEVEENNRQHVPSYGASSYHDHSWEDSRESSSSWEILSGQDGMSMGGGGSNNGQNDTGIKFGDWRSYAGSSGTVGVRGESARSVANPNDEEDIESVYINGKPPGKRAGHTATAVGRHIYVFGGKRCSSRESYHPPIDYFWEIFLLNAFFPYWHWHIQGSCGTDYLNDFFVLDTDPAPLMKATAARPPQLYAHRLQHFYNDEEFSDVSSCILFCMSFFVLRL